MQSGMSLLTQLLDSKINPPCFQQVFTNWETIKTRFEKQIRANLPESILIVIVVEQCNACIVGTSRMPCAHDGMKAVMAEYCDSRNLVSTSSALERLPQE